MKRHITTTPQIFLTKEKARHKKSALTQKTDRGSAFEEEGLHKNQSGPVQGMRAVY